jgi:hypothetical protein
MRRGLGAIVLLLALPGAAAAQRENEKLVAEGGGSRLLAEYSRSGSLCMTIEYPNGVGGTCAERVTAREPAVAPMDGVTAGAVAPEVERVEVEGPDGVRTAGQPVAHPAFPGVRFFLVAHAGRSAWLVRYFAADGALLAVQQEGDGPVVAGPVRLASGRTNGRRWSVVGRLERVLAPGPGAPERTEIIACVDYRKRHSGGTQCSAGEPRLAEPIAGQMFGTAPIFLGARSPHRLVLAAVLGPAAARVDVHLGSGQVVRARVRELAAEGATGRFATYAARPEDAVRRLVVRDAAGAEIDQQVVTLAPGALGHFGQAGLISLRPPLPGTPEVAAGPVQDGEGVLKVREVGARLCVEVERTYLPDAPCGLVPRTAEESLLVGGASEHHGVVGGVVPPEVATVELEEMNRFPGNQDATVRVATQAPSPYAGAFAPHVRVFVGLLPLGGTVGVRLLDAQGRELGSNGVEAVHVVDARDTPRRARTRLRLAGVRLKSHPDDDDCVFLTDSGAGLLHQTCAFGGREEVDVHVACRPAASVVVVPVGKRRGLVLRTARGRRVKPRRLRLGATPHAVFVVRAPDTPRALTWRGGRVTIGRMPPLRKQCGYEINVELGGPGR